MSLRDDALAAYQAEHAAARTNLVTAARTAVTPVLTGAKAKPADLTVEHVDVEADIVVLADPASTVRLLVRGGTVRPTEMVSGRWTDTGPVVTSLAELGSALA